MEAETLNMIKVPLTRVAKQIKMQLAYGDYNPVIVIGKSGIGKTESISALAKELNIGFVELRLSHYQESDLVGLPFIGDGKTKHAVTDLLPDSNDKGQGILLLDEVTSSVKSMRSAVYQLMDSSRKLGQYKLPEKWLIVCCGNGPDDGGDFRGIEPALMSRGMCMRVEEDIDAWKAWAIRKGIHPTVVAYLSFSPDQLHVFDLERPTDMIACPRNWVKLSTQLTNMEKTIGGMITDEDDLTFSACACVGSQCGPGFAAFYKYNKFVVNVDDIITGEAKPGDVANLDSEVIYITIQNLAKLVNKKMSLVGQEGLGKSKKIQMLANVCKWLIELADLSRLDYAIMGLQDIASAIPEFSEIILNEAEFDEVCPELIEFVTKNSIAL